MSGIYVIAIDLLCFLSSWRCENEVKMKGKRVRVKEVDLCLRLFHSFCQILAESQIVQSEWKNGVVCKTVQSSLMVVVDTPRLVPTLQSARSTARPGQLSSLFFTTSS